MAQFYTLLTDVGQAKLANAVALGSTISIAQLAVGDGGGTLPQPDSGATALINEVRRAPINTSEIDPDNPSWIVVEQVLPPDVGGWTIREIGIIDADGDLIGIGNYPETYKPVLSEGSSRTQTVRFVLEVSDTAAVTLKIDPSVVLATREYVDTQLDEHEQSRNHPSATESLQGMIKLANQETALAGDDNADAMTALGTFQAFSQYGLGRPADMMPVINDADQATTPGFYRLLPSSNGNPHGDNSAALIVFSAGFGGSATQLVSSSYNNNLMYRTGGPGNWQEWTEIRTRGNTTAATVDVAGIVEMASIGEHLYGELDDRSAHPAGVRAAIDAGMGFQNIASFTSPGVSTWNVPQDLRDGRRKAFVAVTGAGGGGAGPASSSAGSGGAGGGTGIGLIDLTGVESVQVTVGAGGAGSIEDGHSGGTSSFGPYITATGGNGGDHDGEVGDGADGGIATGGDVNLVGDASSPSASTIASSNGGASFYSGIGRGSASTGVSGSAGTSGCGGGGARSGGGSGGRGGDGIVIVRW
ncbi:Phage tail-collar fibre protein [Modicisalibacter ilicicola DSM 19980]|uniref:Phage tail-collar fibre protein n=1 Tax=Modicisalibacter ilicicola DSM 19980 TaxID=1121942 RepID=A0A1M4Y377_9GAMM|nr:phage tail protein [Halomonas ilicicola]SHF00274.1 Phage tail-collar fibre protein [Halomonas ilicicola DSM 19980]